MQIKIKEDLDFSRISYGFMNAYQWDLPPRKMLAHIESVIDQGITTFDHADIYGSYTCESHFGNALKLKTSLRDKIQLISKCGIQLISENRSNTYIKHYDTSYQHIIKSVNTSLENLHTDYLDLLLIHRPDPLMRYYEIAEAFYQLSKEGKVRYFGVSNFSVQQYKTLQSYLDLSLATNQIEISLDCLDGFYDGNIDFLSEQKVPPMAWSPLAGGRIFHPEDEKSERIHQKLNELIRQGVAKSSDQILLAWLLHHPVGIIPVIGSGKIERIKSAIESFKVELTTQQWFELWSASTGKPVP